MGICQENTREKQPMHVYKMSELIREMLRKEKLDFLKEEIPMYVMTNEKRCLGACGILYDHILQEAARLLEDRSMCCQAAFTSAFWFRKSSTGGRRVAFHGA